MALQKPRTQPASSYVSQMLKLFGGVVLIVFLYRLWSTPGLGSSIGEMTTQLVRPLVLPVVDLINAPSFVFIASALLFLSAVLVCWFYWSRSVSPELRSLKECDSELGSLLRDNAQTWKGWPQLEAGVGSVLISNRTLIAPWAALTADIATQGRFPAKPFAAYAAEDPSAANNRSSLISAMPGYYISVGLLLTFLGLVVALYFAARGFRAGNMEESRQAIVQLLNASSFKFLTSVAALCASLLISVFARWARSLVQRARDQVIVRIEAIVTLARQMDRTEYRQTGSLAEVVARLDAVVDMMGKLLPLASAAHLHDAPAGRAAE